MHKNKVFSNFSYSAVQQNIDSGMLSHDCNRNQYLNAGKVDWLSVIHVVTSSRIEAKYLGISWCQPIGINCSLRQSR